MNCCNCSGVSIVDNVADEIASGMEAKQLKQALESTRTAEDHIRIADYYAAQAERFERKVKEQSTLADSLRKSTNGFLETKHPMSPGTVGHAEWLAGRYFTSAEMNRRLEKQQGRQLQAAPR